MVVCLLVRFEFPSDAKSRKFSNKRAMATIEKSDSNAHNKNKSNASDAPFERVLATEFKFNFYIISFYAKQHIQ